MLLSSTAAFATGIHARLTVIRGVRLQHPTIVVVRVVARAILPEVHVIVLCVGYHELLHQLDSNLLTLQLAVHRDLGLVLATLVNIDLLVDQLGYLDEAIVDEHLL